MSATIYILGIVLQAVAGIVAVMQLRFAPRRLPWLLIAVSSLLIVARRSATLGQFMRTNRELASAEVLTLIISFVFFLGVLLMSRMFRETREAEKAVLTAFAYNRSLIEASLDPLVTIGPDGTITDVNSATEKATGLTRQALIGTNFADYFTDPQKARAGYIKVFEEGQVQDYGLELKHTDGSSIPVLYNASVYKDDEGHVTGVFAAARDITELRKAESALQESLKEKEVLLKEIHHRVKNNLMVVASIINLQSGMVDDSAVRVMMDECRKRIQVMSLIHNKLYRSSDLARINFREYADDLLTDLVRSYEGYHDGIAIAKDIGDFFFDIDTTIPLGLIVNELFSNAMKHAFPADMQGTITVKLERRPDRYELSVTDDGVGFPEDLDFTQTESLGMQLVVTLAEQLEGSIELIRDRGTTFRLAFGQEQDR